MHHNENKCKEAWKKFKDYLTVSRYSPIDPDTKKNTVSSYDELIGIICDKLTTELSVYLDRLPVGGTSDKIAYKTIDKITSSLKNRLLIPATPFLMSYANTFSDRKGLFSCYPLGYVQDSVKDILKTGDLMTNIYIHGGGVGIDISKLRGRGTFVDNSQGKSSGPMEFLAYFDKIAGTINQGGRRRGALMASMDATHPDIMEFVSSKISNGKVSKFLHSLPAADRLKHAPYLSNVNISVKMEAKDFENKDLVRAISKNMHESGDPGILFIDNMRNNSPYHKNEVAEFVNPCAEFVSPALQACNLFTINVAKIYTDAVKEYGDDPMTGSDSITFNFLKNIAQVAAQATILGNFIIDIDDGYPTKEIRLNTQRLRPVGIGMSGFHTAWISHRVNTIKDKEEFARLGYGSKESIEFIKAIQCSILAGSVSMSSWLAPILNVDVEKDDTYWKNHIQSLNKEISTNKYLKAAKISDFMQEVSQYNLKLANCVTTSQAPTGSVSCFLENIDSGIEPIYSTTINRRVGDFESATGWVTVTNSSEILDHFLPEHYSTTNKDIIDNLQDLVELELSHKISPVKQLQLVSALQSLCHTGISKTINVPASITVEEIEDIIYEAKDLGLKGFTIYRDTSLEGILSDGDKPKDNKIEKVINTKPIVTKNKNKLPGENRAYSFKVKGQSSSTSHINTTVNKNGEVVEVFIQQGDIGGFLNSMMSGTAIAISVGLKNNPSEWKIYTKALGKILTEDRYVCHVADKPDPIVTKSIPAMVGRIIEYVSTKREAVATIGRSATISNNLDLCPTCQELGMRRNGNCDTCIRCGHSTC